MWMPLKHTVVCVCMCVSKGLSPVQQPCFTSLRVLKRTQTLT